MEYLAEPKITAFHKFNLTDMEQFAHFVAEKTHQKVNLIFLDSTKNKTIDNNSDTTSEVDLIEQNPTLNSTFKWVLEKGEEAWVLYQDSIDINIPLEMDYFEMHIAFQENNLKKDPYFSVVCNQLQNLGLKEIYISNFEELQNSKLEGEALKKEILNTKNHFIINL